MSGKQVMMAEYFARMVLRSWRDKEPMKCCVVLACGCHAVFEVDDTPRRYEDLIEGYLALCREHICPVKNPARLTSHEELVAEIKERPPWQDV